MLLALLLSALTSASAFAADPAYKAGTAVRIITPADGLWMAGYASRTKPAEGKEHDLFVKALALRRCRRRPAGVAHQRPDRPAALAVRSRGCGSYCAKPSCRANA